MNYIDKQKLYSSLDKLQKTIEQFLRGGTYKDRMVSLVLGHHSELVSFLNDNIDIVMDLDNLDQVGVIAPFHDCDTNEFIVTDLFDKLSSNPHEEISPATLVRLFEMENYVKGVKNV